MRLWPCRTRTNRGFEITERTVAMMASDLSTTGHHELSIGCLSTISSTHAWTFSATVLLWSFRKAASAHDPRKAIWDSLRQKACGMPSLSMNIEGFQSFDRLRCSMEERWPLALIKSSRVLLATYLSCRDITPDLVGFFKRIAYIFTPIKHEIGISRVTIVGAGGGSSSPNLSRPFVVGDRIHLIFGQVATRLGSAGVVRFQVCRIV